MSTPAKILIPRPYLTALVLGVITTLVFSSWGNISRIASVHELAGANAFRKTIVNSSVTLKGVILNYQATSGYLVVNDGDNHCAQLFYTAYNSGAVNKPLTFVFNGGPGSSSVWLHMGSFGPVRAVPGKPGYKSNPDTWLGFTDLVFIDPVGTGYSRPADGVDARRFYGYREDIQSVASFIQQYLKENNRQQSPVFLAGESYGAARAVGLAAYLKDTAKVNIAGLTLISPALNYRLVSFRKGNDQAYPYYLSGYALAAQYHHRLSSALQALPAAQLKAKVDAFAFGTYAKAILNGSMSDKVIDTLSQYTGIATATLGQLNGKLTDNRFAALLLSATDGKTGIYDSRDIGAAGAADPSEQRLRAVLPQAFKQFKNNALHYQNSLPYLATIATPSWNYGPEAKDGYLNVVPVLQRLLKADASINVHLVNGDYDLATPPATIDKLKADLGNEMTKVTANSYAAGHMIYTDDAANKQWRSDSEQFYRKALIK